MIVGQWLASDHPMKIRLHEMLNNVDLLEGIVRSRLDDVEDADDVFGGLALLEVAQQLELTQRAQSKHLVTEWLHLLDGHLEASRAVNGGSNDAVGPLAKHSFDAVAASNAKPE